jgi:hypothetical protein
VGNRAERRLCWDCEATVLRQAQARPEAGTDVQEGIAREGELDSLEKRRDVPQGKNKSLTITIDRTAEGRFRAELFEDPRLIIEHDELSELVEDLKRNLDLIAVMPDGRLLVGPFKTSRGADEAVARAEVERSAIRNEELDALIDRYPVPVEWGDEPGWSDAL